MSAVKNQKKNRIYMTTLKYARVDHLCLLISLKKKYICLTA